MSYVYDRLSRNILTHYADSVLGPPNHTPDVERHYDGASNGKGRLWWSQKVGLVGTAFNSYDAAGRPTQYHQVYWVGNNWGQSFNVSLSYDKAGNVTSQTYPSGHTVNYGYDAAGRTESFTGRLGDGVQRTYAEQITYSEFGGIQQERFGTQTPLYHKLHYNRRGNRTINATETWVGQPTSPPSDSVNERQFDKADLANTNRLYAPGDAAYAGANYTQRRMQYDAAATSSSMPTPVWEGGGTTPRTG